MKKLFFLAFTASTILLSSCGADQAVVDKMADEACAAMAKYKDGDPSSMLAAASALADMAKKEDEYGKVTEAQLKSAMETKCPDGYKKFMELTKK